VGKLFLFSVVLFLAVPSAAASTPQPAREPDPFSDSSDFISSCRFVARFDSPSLTYEQGVQGLFCLGFVSGVFGAVAAPERYEADGVAICNVGDSTPRAVVTKIIERANNMSEHVPQVAPRTLVIEAIGDMFPCHRGK